MLDSNGAFFELQEIKPFGELQDFLLIEIHLKSLIPQNEPPMLDKMSRLQRIFGGIPIDFDGAFILK